MRSTAVIVIDVQRAILEGKGGARQAETDAALDVTVGRIAELIGRARAAGVPVVFVQHDGGPGHRLAVGTKGWEIRDEIAPLNGEPVIRKTACDSFWETALKSTLDGLGAEHLVVAGCMTQFCVDTTVRRAVSLGFNVTLAGDGHMTTGSGGLTFEQIIAHHNGLLDGFDAGEHSVTVSPTAAITF